MGKARDSRDRPAIRCVLKTGLALRGLDKQVGETPPGTIGGHVQGRSGLKSIRGEPSNLDIEYLASWEAGHESVGSHTSPQTTCLGTSPPSV